MSDAIGQVRIVNDKIVVYNVTGNAVFTAGRDSIKVLDSHTKIVDKASPDANFCISDQKVIILPQ